MHIYAKQCGGSKFSWFNTIAHKQCDIELLHRIHIFLYVYQKKILDNGTCFLINCQVLADILIYEMI